MSPELERRALDIVIQLSEASQADRSKLQEELCGTDAELRSAVEKLWSSHQAVFEGSFLQQPALELMSPSFVQQSASDDGSPVAASTNSDEVTDGPRVSRFQPMKKLGVGGQGEVWLALDPELNRHVALKVVKPSLKGSQSTVAKFWREAEVTGKLEHPNIVPVYEAGHDTDKAGTSSGSSPFYVMRVISDDTLQKAINAFHAGEWVETGLRSLLGRFIDVCDAIAYAHSRGVIHRDLKPNNVMLGEFGETLVVDWGLAKVIGRGEPTPESDGLETLNVAPVGDETLAGTILGTPQYMSPEQAEGKIQTLGPATDIYALGAILFCMLTGQAPISSRPRLLGEKNGSKDDAVAVEQAMGDRTPKLSVDQILEKVCAGDFPRPTTIDPRVPRALEAICLKAMSLAARDRFATATELAAQVRRWLDDEPVNVWREPVIVRARRWVRRHQTLVTSTAATILVGIVSLSVLLALNSFKNKQLTDSNRKLDDSNQKLTNANSNLEIARNDAVKNADESRRNELLAQDNERRAIKSEQKEKQLKQEAVDTAVRANLGRGEDYLEQQDLLAANVLFAEAFRVASTLQNHSPEEAAIHRLRFGLTASLAPRLENTLFGDAPVEMAEFSPSGEQVALLQPIKGTVRVWDAQRGVPIAAPMKHKGAPRTLAFSPNGKRLATWAMNRGNEAIVYLWETETGKSLAEAKAVGRIKKLAFNHDGSRLATGSHVGGLLGTSGAIQFWDGETLKPEGDPIKTSKPVNSIAFSPDSSLLAAAVVNGKSQVTIWKTTDRSVQCEGGDLKDHPPVDVCFSPDGTKVGVASNTGPAQVIDSQTGAAITPLLKHDERLEGPDDGSGRALGFITFSPDSRFVLTACGDRTARLWNATSGEPVGKIMEHAEDVTSCQFSPDGNLIGTSCRDGTARLWETGKGVPVASPLRHVGLIFSLRFSPNGKQFLTSSADRTARLWTYQPPAPISPVVGLQHSALSDDGRWLVGTSGDQKFQVWDAVTLAPAGVACDCSHSAHLVAFAPGRTRLALAGLSANKTGQVSVFDFMTGQLTEESLTLTGMPLMVGFSPDGRWCAVLTTTSKEGKSLMVRDLQEHRSISLEVTQPDDFVWNPAADAQLFVAARDGLIRKVSFPEGSVVATGAGLPGATIRHFGLSQNGEWMTTTSGNEVQVWKASDGEKVYQPLKHDDTPNGAVLSTDNKRLLTWGHDGVVKLWNKDVEQNQWREAGRFRHSRPINDAAFSPDGLLMASASDDGTVRLWDLKSQTHVSPALIHQAPRSDRMEVQRVRFQADGRGLFSASQNLEGLLRTLPSGALNQFLQRDSRSMESTLRRIAMRSNVRVWRWPFQEAPANHLKVVALAQFTAGKKLDQFGLLRALEVRDLPPLLDEVSSEFPNAWIWQQQLAQLRRDSDDLNAAAQHYAKAIQDQKKDGPLWTEYAIVLSDLNRFQEAHAAATEAINLGYTESKVWLVRGRSARQLGKFAEAIDDLKVATERSLVPCFARLDLANCQAQLGQWDEAAASFDQSFQEHLVINEPVEHADRYRRVVLELARQRTSEYQQLAQAMLKQNAGTADAYAAFYSALSCVLRPDTVDDWSPVVKLATFAAEKAPNSADDQAVLGYALFRSGKFEDAERQLRQSITMQKPATPERAGAWPLPQYFLALTLQAQGQSPAASELLKTANEMFAAIQTGPPQVPLIDRLPWQRRVVIETVRQQFQNQ